MPAGGDSFADDPAQHFPLPQLVQCLFVGKAERSNQIVFEELGNRSGRVSLVALSSLGIWRGRSPDDSLDAFEKKERSSLRQHAELRRRSQA